MLSFRGHEQDFLHFVCWILLILSKMSHGHDDAKESESPLHHGKSAKLDLSFNPEERAGLDISIKIIESCK